MKLYVWTKCHFIMFRESSQQIKNAKCSLKPKNNSHKHCLCHRTLDPCRQVTLLSVKKYKQSVNVEWKMKKKKKITQDQEKFEIIAFRNLFVCLIMF